MLVHHRQAQAAASSARALQVAVVVRRPGRDEAEHADRYTEVYRLRDEVEHEVLVGLPGEREEGVERREGMEGEKGRGRNRRKPTLRELF